MRAIRVLGGRCAKGHLLSPDNVYREGTRVRCATCHLERCAVNQRIRKGSKPKYRIDPEALWTCRCGKTMVRREFGQRGVNRDGTIKYQSTCGSCRVKASNERVKARIAIRLASEREERANLTQWIIDQARRLKREWKVKVQDTREALGVPRKTWNGWCNGRYLPEMDRLRHLVETMQAWIARWDKSVKEPEPIDDSQTIKKARTLVMMERKRLDVAA